MTRAQVPTLTLSSVTVPLSAPGTYYLDRQNQLDLQFGKRLTYGRTHFEPEVGIFNALKAATVLRTNDTYGPALGQVQQIIEGRVVRFGMRVDF